jgi:hypothetical protein
VRGLPIRYVINIREVYSFGSIISTISIIINPLASIRSILVTLLVTLSSSAILLGVLVKY